MEEKPAIDNLLTHAREYAEERIKLISLNIHDKVSKAISGITAVLVIMLLVIFTMLFLSVAISWWLGRKLDDPFLGFLIVGGFYLLITILIYANRTKWIRLPVINTVLKMVANEED